MSDQLNTRVTRLEEQTKSLRYDVSNASREVKELENDVKAHYVTKTELSPIAKLVYGAVSLILVAVAGALLALVTKG